MSKWGIPERDIWSLGVMVQGSGQMGELSARRRRRRRHLENWEIWKSRYSHFFENWRPRMLRIDPSRQDSMSDSNFRFYCNQKWPKIEFLVEIWSKIPQFYRLGQVLYMFADIWDQEPLPSEFSPRKRIQMIGSSSTASFSVSVCMYVYIHIYIYIHIKGLRPCRRPH